MLPYVNKLLTVSVPSWGEFADGGSSLIMPPFF